MRWALLVIAAACARAPDPAPAPVPAASSTPPPIASPSIASPSISAVPSIAPPPGVDVRAIGMHIGGGPNDDANKAPLLASIEKHHQALAQCWASLPNKPRLELGVDAPGKGGRAKIDHPRSTVHDPAFIACAVKVFEAIEFLPPKSGLDTTVSASVRMTPRG